jgi:hypothetical protein
VTAALDLLRFAGLWALGASVTTAGVSALARTLCLPPYWPAEHVLRCRPEGLLRPLLLAPADAALTTALLFVPALAVGAGLHVLVRLAPYLLSAREARVLAVLTSAGLWFVLVWRLEPSYLDFTVSGYATAAGAAVAAYVSSRSLE